MGDVFLERMVKRKYEPKDMLITIGVVLAVVILSIVGFFVGMSIRFPMLTLLIAMGAGYGGYRLISMRNLEFEYSITNGYLAVDKIMNRSTRKRITAFECSTCEDIGEFNTNAERLKNRSFDARIYATASSDNQGAWFMIVASQKTGKTLLVFNPDEDMLEAVKKFIPRPLKFEKFGRS